MSGVERAWRALLDHVDVETCHHEDTHRGGHIWTICDGCGRKWADDEGGFVPHKDAPAVAKARAALSAIEGGGGALQPSPSEQAGGFTGAQLDAEAHSRWQHDGQMIQRAAFRDGAYWAAGLFAPPATPIAGGFGSSPDGDTHRAADTAVVGGQIAWRVGTPPQDGSTFYGHWWSPCRWLAYKPNSEQARRGVKGRWQTMNEFGGWVNASAPNEWATEAQIRARQQAAPASDTTARYEPEASEPKDAARRDEEAGR